MGRGHREKKTKRLHTIESSDEVCIMTRRKCYLLCVSHTEHSRKAAIFSVARLTNLYSVKI